MYYSPILFSTIADLNLTPYDDREINIEYLNSKNKIIVFCLQNMGYFDKLNIFLNNVSKPFVLISAMEDTEVPNEININFYNKLVNNIFLIKWFCINKTVNNTDKLISIPYGLNFWTLNVQNYFGEIKHNFLEQNNSLENIINNSLHFSKRINLIYCNSHLNCTDVRRGNVRHILKHILPNNLTYFEDKVYKRSTLFTIMSEYSFVISPYGNGWDCIRTFEALCLGCIVIMKKDFLSILYDDLPVLFVDDFSKINKELLDNTLIDFSKRTFNYEKLKFDYWKNLVLES